MERPVRAAIVRVTAVGELMVMRGKVVAALATGVTLLLGVGAVSASGEAILFSSGFESNSLSGWTASGNDPVVQSQITRMGRYAIQSTLDRNNSAVPYRTEVRAIVPNPVRGQDTWYGFSIYLPDPYAADTLEESLAQWHKAEPAEPGDTVTQPPMALHSGNGRWTVVTRSATDQPTTNATKQEKKFDLGPYKVGEWTDWVFRVRWNWTGDGELQVWKNGVEVIKTKGPIGYNDAVMPYFKMGIYKPLWKNYVGVVTKRVMYHDEFRMAGPGGSYYDVAPGPSDRPKAPTLAIIR